MHDRRDHSLRPVREANSDRLCSGRGYAGLSSGPSDAGRISSSMRARGSTVQTGGHRAHPFGVQAATAPQPRRESRNSPATVRCVASRKSSGGTKTPLPSTLSTRTAPVCGSTRARFWRSAYKASKFCAVRDHQFLKLTLRDVRLTVA